MTRIIRKKFLAVILTLAMVIGLLPALTLTAKAANIGPISATMGTQLELSLYTLSGGENLNIATNGGTYYYHSYTQPVRGGKTAELYFVEDGDLGYGHDYEDATNDSVVFFLAQQTGTYTFTVTFKDVDEMEPTITSNITVEVTGGNTAPTVTATGGTPTFTQGGSSGVDLYSAITAATNDSGQTFSGATLTVTNVSDATEYLTVGSADIALTNGASEAFTGGNYSVSVSGTTATVTLSGMTMTNAAMGTLIDGITYKNSAASVTAGNRVITLTSVTDSGSSNNSATLNIAATVTVTKLPATAANSTVSVSAASVLADGTATSTITVTLKDTNSNPVGGKTVTLAQGSGSSTISAASGVSDAGGVVTFTVKSTKAEAVTYTATDTTDTVTVTQTAAVTFTAGTPTAANSAVTSSPASVEANGTATATITVTLKDAYDNPVGGKTVTLAAGSGSSTITTVSGTTDSSGQATFTVKDSALETVTYTATDTTDTVTVTQTAAVSFTAGTPTAANSTVSASEATVLADGTATSTITVTLKDTNGNVVNGKTVTLAQGSGSSTITTVSGTTDVSGQATFTVKSTTAEAVTYTATDTTDSLTVTQTATVTFTAGTPTASNSTVTASPASVEANGTSTSTITVTLKDTNGNAVNGKTVTLSAGSGSSTITTVSGTTDSSGQATFTVMDSVLETVTYTATDTTDSVTVTQTASVMFTAGTPTAANSTVSASEATVLADGTATSTITVTLKDTNGNPVSGKTVTLAQGSGSSTITTVSGTTNASGQATFTVKSTKAEAVTYMATDTTDSVTVTQTAAVTFTVPTYTATINTKIDGTATDMTSVVLKSGSSAVAASKTSTGVYTATAANGTYTVYVNGVYTGVDITVHYAAASTDVYYYTVLFDAQGGGSVNSQTVLSGGKAAIPAALAKSGNTFAGWYTDTGYGTAWNFSTGTIAAARTLYAKWTPVLTYSVTYAGNGSTSGSIPVDSNAYASGATVTVKGNTGSLAKTGNAFTGWSNGTATYTAGQTFAITGNITLTAVWTAVASTYTATYSYNYTGSGTYTTQNSLSSGAVLTAPAVPTRGGYTFIGWYKDSTCVNPWNFSADTVSGNTTLYARWSENTYFVGGTVKDDTTPTPNAVSGATIKVMQGNVLFGETITASDGTFTVMGVPNGVYNLVITKGSQEVTVCITVTGINFAAGTVILPSGNRNSTLEVNGSGTPNVVVDNLNGVFGDSNVYTPANDNDVTNNGSTVEIKLTVQKNDSSTNKTTVEATMTSGGYTTGMVLDVDMTKTVTSNSGALTDESPVTAVSSLISLIIPLPTELQGKDSYVVTRAHDYNDGNGIVVDTITTSNDATKERIVVSSDKTQLTLYVKYFSTYAIGYTTTSGGGTGGGGSSSSYYSITATAGTGGSISPTSASVVGGGSKTFTITPDEGYVISDVLVDGESVGAVGSYTFSNIKAAHSIKAVFAKVAAGWTNPFADVCESDWFYNAVKYVSEAGLMDGTSETAFGPGLSTTRGMIVTILWRLENKPEAADSSSFSDVTTDEYYTEAVAWAAANGIVLGYDANTYGPDDTITREQLAVILYRYAKYKGYDMTATSDLSAFTDSANISAYALPPMKWAVAEGIVTGTIDTTLSPNGKSTRAQVAVILTRFIENVVE